MTNVPQPAIGEAHDPAKVVVAIPSMAPGGLDASLSPHFGHCDVFTLVTLGTGGVERAEVVPSVPHEHNGCMGPVNVLKGAGAHILIAAGIGPRPLYGLAQVGIEVYHAADSANVREAVSALVSGRLPQFSPQDTCHAHHH